MNMTNETIIAKTVIVFLGIEYRSVYFFIMNELTVSKLYLLILSSFTLYLRC